MGSSEEHKSHKHKHSKHSHDSKRSHKSSKHKHHKSHHRHKHHKKSHKKDHNISVEAGIEGQVDTKALELLMTEHLLAQLEQSVNREDGDDESVDSDQSTSLDGEEVQDVRALTTTAAEPSKGPSSSPKDPSLSKSQTSVEGPQPSIGSGLDKNMDSQVAPNVPQSQTISDSEVTSTSSQPLTIPNALARNKSKSIKINIRKEQLETLLGKKESTKSSASKETKSSSHNTGSDSSSMTGSNVTRDSVTVKSGNSKVTYLNLKSGRSNDNDDRVHSDTNTDSSEFTSRRDKKKKKHSSSHSSSHRRSSSRSVSPHRYKSSRRKRSSSRSKTQRRSHSRHRRSRSDSRSRRRPSNSRSRHSRHRSNSRKRYSSRSPRRRYSRHGSPARDRYKRQRYSSRSRSGSYSRSRSRSHSRSRRRRSRSYSRETSPKKPLPPSAVVETVSKIAKTIVTSKKHVEIDQLTSLCEDLQDKQAKEDLYGPDETKSTKEIRAPFEVKSAPVYQPNLVYHDNAWKTSNQVVLESNALKAIKPVEEVFPVSTGVQHAGVESSNSKADNVFDQSKSLPVSDLVVQRLEATRRLQYNPADYEAHVALTMIEQQTAAWAQSKVKPGQFTGQQQLNPLTREDHKAGMQAWAKKTMFHDLAPVMGGFGLKMLKKMGWKEGEPLGIHGQGFLVPLAVDVKMDRSGLKSAGDTVSGGVSSKSKPSASQIAQGKHPVSALQEICQKRHWGGPQYHSVGPSNNTAFLFKVVLPTGTYQPLSGSNNKKEAKCQAAAAALHGLGLTEKTIEYSYSAL